MTIKQILKLNIILFIAIIITIVVILLFNSYLYKPYNALNDLRETERRDALDESEIPSTILTSGNKFVEEYHQALEEKNISNLETLRAYTELDREGYTSVYILVDTKKNKVLADIVLLYNKKLSLKKINIDYREFNEEDFFLYNKCLINLKSLNFSKETTNQINQYLKEKPKDDFKIENTYMYNYLYREPTAQLYIRIKELRRVVIFL